MDAPAHLRRRSLRGTLYRRRIRRKVRLSRFANMGANAPVFHGIVGVLAVLAGLLMRAFRVVDGWLDRFAGVLAELLRPRLLIRKLRDGFRRLCSVVYRFHVSLDSRTRSRLPSALLMLSVTIMLLSFSYLNLGLLVRYNGEVLGYVNNREEMDALVEDVEQRAAVYLGKPYSLAPNLRYEVRYIGSTPHVDGEAFKNQLFSTIDHVSRQYVLTVDGTLVGANSSRLALEMMLRRIILTRSAGVENVKTEFVQDVRIEERPVLSSQLRTIAEIEEQLSVNVAEIQTYRVVDGDTVSAIAKAHGLSLSDIRELNPELNVDFINIGDEILLSGAVPFLSLKKTVTEAYDEEVPYETELEYDDSMYVNRSYIRVAGVPGKAHVTADVVYIDDTEDSRTVLTYEVFEQPSSAIKVVGTKPLPAKAATGSFVKPCNGYFSSPFGYRPSLGDYHTGVDYAASTGTSIWAADGGVVIYAGRKGNYGNCVMINHDDNGFVTLYAHCSRLLVSVGQRVAKYEEIAKVGSTGRAYGAHCHFEVRLNGKTVNPLKYVWK